MERVRFGVLSTARIASEKVIPAMQRGQRTSVQAIASRDLAKARLTADRLGVPVAFGSYEELLASTEIDAVYIPLPNHLHVPWSIRATEAGKHVLCEKPIGLSTAEAMQLMAVAQRHPHIKVMEAFMYRHHPQWQLAKKIVQDGGIGRLRTIQSFFSYYNDDEQNIRNTPEIGGGALMDIGCYCVSLARFLFGDEPRQVLGQIERDPRFGTDVVTSGILKFDRGTASFTCGTLLAPFQRVQIVGESGRVEIEIPFNAPPDRACRIWHQQNKNIEEILLPVCDQYAIQGDLFAEAILNDLPVPTPLADAVANMCVLGAIFQSAQENAWTRLTSDRADTR
jgi:predicted dehydrogenase